MLDYPLSLKNLTEKATVSVQRSHKRVFITLYHLQTASSQLVFCGDSTFRVGYYKVAQANVKGIQHLKNVNLRWKCLPATCACLKGMKSDFVSQSKQVAELSRS